MSYLKRLTRGAFKLAIEKFNYKAKMNLPKKKRNASSAGVSNAGSLPNKKGGKRGKCGGYQGNNSRVFGGSNNGKPGQKVYYNTANGKPTGRSINHIDVEAFLAKGKIPLRVICPS